MNGHLPLLALSLFCLALAPAHAQPGDAEPDHWAFRPVRPLGLPSEIRPTAENAVDAWHQDRLAGDDLPMAGRASRRVLARRLAFHLHGLPPAFADVEAFAVDPSPNAYGRHLDRLLASPRYGERWARHWMDVARYADNKGYVFQEERRYPYAYTYRDWLVSAFNADLPFDDFIVQQLAGDHVAQSSDAPHAYAAMGFLTLGRRFLNRQPDIIDDRIDVVTRGMLGLTVACARCHDHKFDPIPIEDYYSLYGVFASSYEPDEKPLLGQPDTASPAYQDFIRESEERQAKIDEFFRVRHEKLRSASVLQAYFKLAHEGREWDKPAIESRAQREKLYQKTAVQWRDRISKLGEENHPAFTPWHALAALPDPFPAETRDRVLEEIRQKSHPALWKAIGDADAKSMNDVIEVYAREIAAANHSEPHADPDRESLRQLLVSRDSPTGLQPEQLYRIFNTPDQEAVRRLRRELKKHQAMAPGAPPRGMVMLDRDRPVDPHVFVRGNPRSRGKQVPRQYLQVLAGTDRQPFEKGSGRYELAQAIASTDNPLTARVFVNRVWMHFFGQPMVTSPSDFGVRTEAPKLLHVLDQLAGDFMRHGWSVKRLHREILHSAVYRQASLAQPAALTGDPENRAFTRMRRQRLGFEAMRDSLLASSNTLDLQTGGQPVDILSEPFSRRRSLYGFIDRQNLPGTFRTFDLASPDAHTPRRLETMVPQQALYMMNGPLVDSRAKHVGAHAATLSNTRSPREAVRDLYRRLLVREPDEEEISLGIAFVQTEKSQSDGGTSPWQAYAHALLSSNEFLFID